MFGPADRDRISRQRGVDLTRHYLEQRQALYQSVLDHRSATHDLDADDRSVLAHVADTLALSATDLRPVHERAFGLAVEAALEDDRLCVEERLLLYRLQHTLGLDPRLAEGAYRVLAREKLLRPVAKALSDGVLSPEEEATLELTASDLDIKIPPDLDGMLENARSRWQARQRTTAAPAVSLRLEGAEARRFEAAAWWRYANASKLTAWAGYAAVQAGQTQGLMVPSSALRGSRREGVAAITDRRLVLQAERAIPDSIALDRVEQTLRFRNGAVIRLANGRRYFVDAGGQRDDFYRHLYYAVDAARSGVREVKQRHASASRTRASASFEFFDIRWRKVLTAEVAEAKESWFGTARPSTVVKRLGESPENKWELADFGYAVIDAEYLTYRGRRRDYRRRTSLRTIESVRQQGTHVWISRPHSHDWLVRCANEPDARRFTETLRLAVVSESPS